MAESLDAFAELRSLRLEVEQQGGMLNALVRYSPEIKNQVIDEFKKDPVMTIIYQLIDGKRSQKEIIAELTRRGVKGASAPTVTRRIERLRDDLYVIMLLRADGQSPIYAHSRLGRVLGIGRSLGKLEKFDA